MAGKVVDIFHIEWFDANSRYGWQSFKDGCQGNGPSICESVGYLVDQDKHSMTLCGSLSEDCLADTTTIPKVNIKRAKKIGRAYRKF